MINECSILPKISNCVAHCVEFYKHVGGIYILIRNYIMTGKILSIFAMFCTAVADEGK